MRVHTQKNGRYYQEGRTIFDSILKFLGSQNFALTATDIPDMCILRNSYAGRSIFCVLADNTRTRICSATQLQNISARITGSGNSGYICRPEDILFIIVTGDVNRDKHLASIGLKVWLADTASGRLLIFEEQPDDFYGLKEGIEAAITGEYTDGMFEFRPFRKDDLQKNEGSGQSGRNDVRGSASYGTGSAGSQKTARNIPFVTIALIVLNVAYYLVLAARGNVSDTTYMLQMGANFGPFVFQRYEIWRLITSMFMHFSLAHLASNMLYLAIAGYNLEKKAGRLKFFIIYMLSGIGGSLVSAAYYYIRGTNIISGGASGAIYGLIGSIALLTFISFRKLKPTFLFVRIVILLIFVFYTSFTRTGVDGAAHIGGFFFGILLTFFLLIGGKKHEK